MSLLRKPAILLVALALAVSLLTPSMPLAAEESCQIPHPISPPNPKFKGQCPNCGMVRAMWARTWMTFENSEGKSQVCSLHCLADVARKSGETPRHVQVALYTRPDAMHPSQHAFFVVGSSARGTMTMQSKIAFANQNAADRFIRFCGGQLASYDQAFNLARQAVVQENKMITAKRKTKNKIVEPRDNQDRCPVCEMYPARYPRHKNQVHTRENDVYHFCSTQCLFTFLEDSYAYAGRQVEPFLLWVVGYETGDWISAWTAYYLVGAGETGPMGREAFAFDLKTDAEAFARQHGGTVMPFSAVTREKIMK